MSTLLKRVLSAIVMIGCLILLIYIGGPAIWIAVAVIAGTAEWELSKALKIADKESGKRTIAIIGIAVSALMYGGAWLFDYKMSFLLCPIVYLIFLFAYYVFNYGKISILDVVKFIFVFIYIAVFLGFIPVIRDCVEYGKYLTWLALIPSIASDTFAYFVGSAIGKHKLAPVVSPKKSIEGSVGGVLGSALCAGLYGLFVSSRIEVLPGFIIACAIIGLVNGGISQVGDLTASAIKRESGIKDYGNIIPGHGGALDRIDSVLYIAPIVYVGVVILNMYFM